MNCKEFKRKMAALNEEERKYINKLSLIDAVNYLQERG